MAQGERMQREIKFRVWDKVKKYWCAFDIGDITEGDMNDIRNDVIVLQYTGLKDKNGKEIYEFMEINKKYEVNYVPPKYVLTNISNGDIMDISEVEKNENGIEVTKEYAKI